MLHTLLSKFDNHIDSASAHCDIPCGIYDARIVTYYAVSTLRQMDILLSLKDKGLSETAFAMQAARNTAKKEEMAENTKHQTRIIWGDFMKGDHLVKHPGAHELAHKIMMAGSACKQDLHREDGLKLVELCNEFAEMFWDMKGVKTKKVTTPYAPNVEVVEPDL
ncbi:nickel superoxide dismutase [Litorimonas taeanensis]|uniref:Nickel superoxide dismutase n=1 Tax=Litorimonas taeanensis TaxID=568099 RepID=A0A420WKK6_9PROT|nr:superoxide dismutase, Ni [Litorimonas taeanensis]RKQ71530.1 nickel superoxide dismutase [Litorimonas taeanensis]